MKAKCFCIINPFWSGCGWPVYLNLQWQHWPYLFALVLQWAHFIVTSAVNKSQYKPPLSTQACATVVLSQGRLQSRSDSYMLIQHWHNSLYSRKCTGMEREPTYTRRKTTGIKLLNPLFLSPLCLSLQGLKSLNSCQIYKIIPDLLDMHIKSFGMCKEYNYFYCISFQSIDTKSYNSF